jgi:seryl-tRNA synthetase
VVDLQQLDLLEQKIVKATELVRSLRKERDGLQTRLKESEDALGLARNQAAGNEKQLRELHEMASQIEALQQERQEVRGKVTRMLDMMTILEEAPAESRRDH